MTPKELQKVLSKHKKWLRNEEVGERAHLRGADLEGAYLRGAHLPMFCKWDHSHIDGEIQIGCEIRTPKEWEDFLNSDEVIETPRDTREFKQIEAVIRAYIAYLKALNNETI